MSRSWSGEVVGVFQTRETEVLQLLQWEGTPDDLNEGSSVVSERDDTEAGQGQIVQLLGD